MTGRNPDRLLDKTYLSIDTAEERGLLHRDYIAHVLRWSHVAKFLGSGNRYKNAVILDVGCGKEVPLAKTLYSNRLIPLHYVGVDANRFEIPEMLAGKKFPIAIWAQSDFCALDVADVGYEVQVDTGVEISINGKLYLKPNVLTCFEVLEHVTPGHCRRMLQHMQEVTSDDCHYFVSTPCFNGSAAENHINEMTFGALGSLMEDLGFKVVEVYGTFASIRDYRDQLSGWTYYKKDGPAGPRFSETVDIEPVFEVLSQYYDTNVLAVIFAPLFPAHSRNCLWHLTKYDHKKYDHSRRFSSLADAPGPWSQHPDWRDLDGPRQ